MATKCYAMVKGSAIRVTNLSTRGEIPEPIEYAVSKSVSKVTINEVVETGGSEALTNEQDEVRLRFNRSDRPIRYTVDIDFVRCDPGILSLVANLPMVHGYATNEEIGFGLTPFGETPFGASVTSTGEVVGFESRTRLPASSFALEVWSKIAGQRCPETGLPQWGYTLFPYLRGGLLSGFTFSGGLVSFNLRRAQTRKSSRWGVGPHDLEGPFQRLTSEIGGGTHFRNILTTAAPPTEQCGLLTTSDILDGGSASMTSDDVIDGGSASSTTAWIVEGGMAV